MSNKVLCTFVPVPPLAVEQMCAAGFLAASEQILTDCNRYVKVDTGTMRDNSYTELASSLELEVVWNTEYALHAWYKGTPSLDKNPQARLQWAEFAAQMHKDLWAKQIERGMTL